MRRLAPAFVLLALLAGCSRDPDTRATDGENRLTAEAVTDVAAARAEARGEGTVKADR